VSRRDRLTPEEQDRLTRAVVRGMGSRHRDAVLNGLTAAERRQVDDAVARADGYDRLAGEHR
jgi:hypothetical protein